MAVVLIIHAALRQGRCAVMVFLKHQLAVLPAMAAVGDAFEEMLIGAAPAENGAADARGTDGTLEAAASLGNSYVEDLSKLGVRDVRPGTPGPCCVMVSLPRASSNKRHRQYGVGADQR